MQQMGQVSGVSGYTMFCHTRMDSKSFLLSPSALMLTLLMATLGFVSFYSNTGSSGPLYIYVMIVTLALGILTAAEVSLLLGEMFSASLLYYS